MGAWVGCIAISLYQSHVAMQKVLPQLLANGSTSISYQLSACVFVVVSGMLLQVVRAHPIRVLVCFTFNLHSSPFGAQYLSPEMFLHGRHKCLLSLCSQFGLRGHWCWLEW